MSSSSREAADGSLRLLLTRGVDSDGSGWVALSRLADSAVSDCRVPDWLREDCRQEALEAAVVNAPEWDADRAVPFEAFLRQRMRWAVRAHLRAMDRMPESVRRDQRRLDAAREALARDGHEVSESALAESAGLSVRRVRHVQSWRVSADEEFSSLQWSREPWFVSAAFQVERAVAAMNRLSRTERRIVQRRYLRGERTVDIAKSEGITPGRVSQLTKRAIERVRKYLD